MPRWGSGRLAQFWAWLSQPNSVAVGRAVARPLAKGRPVTPGPRALCKAALIARLWCVLCVYPFALVGVLLLGTTLRTSTAQRKPAAQPGLQGKDRAYGKVLTISPERADLDLEGRVLLREGE